MDVEEFFHVPRLGEFIVVGHSECQTYQVVQVVHSSHQYGYDYAVTAEKSQLSHKIELRSEYSRDSLNASGGSAEKAFCLD